MIGSTYDDFIEDPNGMTILNTLKDLAIMLSGCTDITRQHFNHNMEGMWNLFSTYADTRDTNQFILIKDFLTKQYVFVKSIEASFPVVKSLATGSKRPFDFDDGFKTSSKTAKVVIPKIVNPIALSNQFEKLSTATTGNDNDRTTEATAPVPKEPRPEPFYVKAQNWR